MISSKTLSLGVILALTTLSFSAFAHDFWINHGNYRSPGDGSHCCGNNDCFALAPDQVKITPRGYVLTGGEFVPFSEAQTSEDGAYWRCKRMDGSRRCFFAPQPSS